MYLDFDDSAHSLPEQKNFLLNLTDMKKGFFLVEKKFCLSFKTGSCIKDI